jgi:hypothetical protein
MRPINHCLNKQLAELCQRSVQLEDLSIKLAKLLPDYLAEHCQVASFNKGCLTLTTPKSEWASQLRYIIPELRDKLRQEAGIYQLTSIKITQAITYDTKPVLPNKHHLSEESKAIIIKESQQCSYEPLQKALLHLAE